MAAIAITPSSDTAWIRPLTALRQRGVGCRVIWLDAPAFAADAAASDADRRAAPPSTTSGDGAIVDIAPERRPARAITHALAEFDLPSVTIGPHVDLTAALTVRQPRAGQLPAAVLGR
jgi:hypothetical protein